MKPQTIFFAAVEFLFITALMFMGAVFFILYHVPTARQLVSDWILNGAEQFLLFGTIFLGLGLLLFISLYTKYRGTFLRVAMKGGIIDIEEQALEKVVHGFWEKEFPKKALPTSILVSSNSIEITTPEPSYDLEEIEKKLGAFLQKELGYEGSFYLNLKANH